MSTGPCGAHIRSTPSRMGQLQFRKIANFVQSLYRFLVIALEKLIRASNCGTIPSSVGFLGLCGVLSIINTHV